MHADVSPHGGTAGVTQRFTGEFHALDAERGRRMDK